MSVRIVGQEPEAQACLYDSVTGLAFGPVFDDAQDAADFLDWYHQDDSDAEDLRNLTGREIEALVSEWRDSTEEQTMNIYTAEATDGTVRLIQGGDTDRDTFAARTVEYLDSIVDPHAPTELTLYEWEDETVAGIWLQGEAPVPFSSWAEMGRKARYGTVAYVWPGEVRYLPDGQPKPRPPDWWLRENKPASLRAVEDSGYAADDPKHPGWHSVRADLWDAREEK